MRRGDFRDGGAGGRGWGGTNAGTYWGGMTIQGLVPYFFEKAPDDAAARGVARARGRALDPCAYNNMATNPRTAKARAPARASEAAASARSPARAARALYSFR